MHLYSVPVIVPYRVPQLGNNTVFTVQVHAVASGPSAAVAVGKVLAESYARIKHGDTPAEVLTERAKVGNQGELVDGWYGYALTKGNFIANLHYPKKITDTIGDHMGEELNGFEDESVYGMIFDCARLAYINSSGLASLAGHAKRLRIQLFRITPPIWKVMEILSLDKFIPMHKDIYGALNGIVSDYRDYSALNGPSSTELDMQARGLVDE